MNIPRSVIAAATGLALMAGGATAVYAQENTAPAAPEMEMDAPTMEMEMDVPTTDFSEAQIEAFAVAFVEVNEIGMSYEQQAQSASSDEELMNLQLQAQEEMAAVVESTEGISIDEYNMILTTAQSDPEFGQQVQAEVDALLQ